MKLKHVPDNDPSAEYEVVGMDTIVALEMRAPEQRAITLRRVISKDVGDSIGKKLERIGEWVRWDEDEWVIPSTGACLTIDANCRGFHVFLYKTGGPEDYTRKARLFGTKAEALDFAMAIMGGERRMTDKSELEKAAESWANGRCPEQGPEFIVWCMCRNDYRAGALWLLEQLELHDKQMDPCLNFEQKPQSLIEKAREICGE